MKAAILTHYDKKGINLELKDIDIPIPEDNEVLVKIHFAGVNPLDNQETVSMVECPFLKLVHLQNLPQLMKMY